MLAGIKITTKAITGGGSAKNSVIVRLSTGVRIRDVNVKYCSKKVDCVFTANISLNYLLFGL